MITMQFPSKENQGVKQIVIHDLSLFDKNQKKSEKIRLTSVYNQHRIFKLSGHITWGWTWQGNRMAEVI